MARSCQELTTCVLYLPIRANGRVLNHLKHGSRTHKAVIELCKTKTLKHLQAVIHCHRLDPQLSEVKNGFLGSIFQIRWEKSGYLFIARAQWERPGP